MIRLRPCVHSNLEEFSPAPDNVHFSGGGNGKLAGQVVATLEKTSTAMKKM